MELFIPGERYGTPYKAFIWVCMNSQNRPFEKCDASASQIVYDALQRDIREHGLTREIILMTSSCMLGCQPNGVSIAIAKTHHDDTPQTVTFFNNVTLPDTTTLIEFAKT